MKHKVRDFIIWFICLCGLTGIYRSRQSKKGALVRVLCFHDVADKSWFVSVLDLLQTKYHLISPDDLQNNNLAKDKINILLTFDDGYQSWVGNCVPELDSRGIKALFFVNSGLLDCADKDEVAKFYQEKVLITTKQPLTWDGAQKLLASGHTIGSHTVNHVRMSKLATEEVKEEVQRDVARLEEVLRLGINHFAYPFGTKGDYTKETIGLIKELGIDYQFSAVTGFVNPDDKTNIIPRTLLENNQSVSSVDKWIRGGYDLFNKVAKR